LSEITRGNKRLHAGVATALATGLIGATLAGCHSDSDKSEATSSASSSVASTASSQNPANAPDPAKVLQESARTTATLQSLHLDLVTENLGNFPLASVSASVTNQPQGAGSAVGHAKFRRDKDADFEEGDFLVTDKTFYTKNDDGTWKKVGDSEKIYDPGVLLDKDRGLAHVLESISDPKSGDAETIDGIKTVQIKGEIPADVIDTIVPTLGLGGGSLPVTVWIADVGTGTQPGAGDPSPSEQPSSGKGPNVVRIKIEKDKGSVTTTFSKWAEPVEIPNPKG